MGWGLAQAGWITVVISSHPLNDYPNIGHWLDDSDLILMPLAIRVTFDGVGITGPRR